MGQAKVNAGTLLLFPPKKFTATKDKDTNYYWADRLDETDSASWFTSSQSLGIQGKEHQQVEPGHARSYSSIREVLGLLSFHFLMDSMLLSLSKDHFIESITSLFSCLSSALAACLSSLSPEKSSSHRGRETLVWVMSDSA